MLDMEVIENKKIDIADIRFMSDIAKFPSENPAPVLRIGLDGKVMYSNYAGMQILDSWQTEIGGNVPAEWLDTFKDVFDKKTTGTGEVENRDRVYSFAIVPVVGADYVNLYGADVTELNQARKIIEDQAKFPSENPAPVLRVNKDGEILYANDAGLRVLNLWDTEIGQNVPEVWRGIIRDAFGSNVIATENQRVDTVVYSFTIVPVYGADYVNLYGRDVTDIIKAEEISRNYRLDLEEEVKLRTEELLENNKLLKKEIEDRKLAENQLSQAQSKLIQSEKMVSIGQLAAGIGHEINNPLGAMQSANTAILDDFVYIIKNIQMELPILAGNMEMVIHVIDRLVNNNHEILSTKEKRLFVKDFSEKHRTDISDTRRVANLLVNIGMAHDYDRLLPLITANDSNEIVVFLEKISNVINSSKVIADAVNHSTRIVYALREYAYSNIKQEKSKENVLKLLENTLVLYHNKLKYDIELITEFEHVPDINCYPGELCQVWANLLHNSIQAMGGKGRIIISLNEVDGNIVVSFRDTGPGIPADIRDKIFEPFFTTKPPGMGTGLGLDIIKRIIDRHSGSISFDSKDGVGTTFIVKLPVN